MRRAWPGLGPSARWTQPLPNRVIVGRKCCPRCGHWRPVSDFRERLRKGGKYALDSYCEACSRARSREQYARLTPKQYALKRERDRSANRFYRDRLAREAGGPGLPIGVGELPNSKQRILLPREPLLAEMESYLLRQRANGHPDFSWEQLAFEVGCPQREIYRIRTGESKRVSSKVADRIAMGIGVPLSMIYRDQL